MDRYRAWQLAARVRREIDARRISGLRLRDRVFHERPPDTSASPLRRYYEVIQIRLWPGQRLEHGRA